MKHIQNNATYLILILVSFSLIGCASNPYKKFYQSYEIETLTEPLPEGQAPRIIEIEHSKKAFNEATSMAKDTYRVIGESSFSASRATRKQLIEHASNVGATVVIHASKYLRTNSGVMPVTTYNYLPGTTTYHNYNGAIGGSNFYGSGTSYTPGTSIPSTSYVPYSINIYIYNAVYLIPK